MQPLPLPRVTCIRRMDTGKMQRSCWSFGLIYSYHQSLFLFSLLLLCLNLLYLKCQLFVPLAASNNSRKRQSITAPTTRVDHSVCPTFLPWSQNGYYILHWNEEKAHLLLSLLHNSQFHTSIDPTVSWVLSKCEHHGPRSLLSDLIWHFVQLPQQKQLGSEPIPTTQLPWNHLPVHHPHILLCHSRPSHPEPQFLCSDHNILELQSGGKVCIYCPLSHTPLRWMINF